MGIELDGRETAISRQQLELAIANIIDSVKRINAKEYIIKSQNGNGDYEVGNSTFSLITSQLDF